MPTAQARPEPWNSHYSAEPFLIVKWKKQLMENSNEVFAPGKGLAPDRESEIRTISCI